MPPPVNREADIIPSPAIKRSYRDHLAQFPKIAATIAIFNKNKRFIPPVRLPPEMKDHVLQGKLAGVRECHLDDDVLLLYTHKDHIVKMIIE